MSDKGREFNGDRKEFHLYFGQEAELGRRYNIYSGERYDSPYIYENDEEMAERYRRFEEKNDTYNDVDLDIERWIKGEDIRDYVEEGIYVKNKNKWR